MRKIETKQDWADFVDDVRFHLQENVVQYQNGYFCISQYGELRDDAFMSDPDFDEDETYDLRFNDLTGDPEAKWRRPERFFEHLSKRFQLPFYIVNWSDKAKYDWL